MVVVRRVARLFLCSVIVLLNGGNSTLEYELLVVDELRSRLFVDDQ